MWETWFDPWVGKIPWRRERLPTPVFWPGELYGLYSPWGHKKLDTTELLLHFSPGDTLGLVIQASTSCSSSSSLPPRGACPPAESEAAFLQSLRGLIFSKSAELSSTPWDKDKCNSTETCLQGTKWTQGACQILPVRLWGAGQVWGFPWGLSPSLCRSPHPPTSIPKRECVFREHFGLWDPLPAPFLHLINAAMEAFWWGRPSYVHPEAL